MSRGGPITKNLVEGRETFWCTRCDEEVSKDELRDHNREDIVIAYVNIHTYGDPVEDSDYE